MGVEILSKADCKYCEHAESLCKNLNLEYFKTIVDKETLKKRCGVGASTYPQVFVNGSLVGDYFKFEEFIEEAEPMLFSLSLVGLTRISNAIVTASMRCKPC